MKKLPHVCKTSPILDFDLYHCSLGQVLIACAAQGVAAVLLGDDSTRLQSDLAQRFAHCVQRAGALTQAQQKWVDSALAHMQQPQSTAWSGPVQLVSGTDFQQRVWQALCAIPAGQTLSYGALATAIGQPEAVRAVASACGANPLAVLVPCHRVLRSDGGLGGYRWGLERKRQLLLREGVNLITK